VAIEAARLPPELLDRIAERLKALADPARLRLLHALEEEERRVVDLVPLLGCTQANVSKHLAVLRRAGLVRGRRDGANVHYRIADPVVFRVCRLLCDSLVREARRTASVAAAGEAAYLRRRAPRRR
jgi:DNA-binding transcriptional ArsR family regulator